MSWDAVILRIRGPIRSAKDVAESEYLPLGSPESVVAAIGAVFPAVKWDSPTHAMGSLDYYTGIIFDFHQIETCSWVDVAVSGSCDPIPLLLALANANDWVILDVQSGDFIDPMNPSHRGWRGYRSLVEGIGRAESS